MRFATNCAKASAPTRFSSTIARIDVRDGKIAAVGYQPPFDLLFSTSEFEYGDRVDLGSHHKNRVPTLVGSALRLG